MKTIFLTGSKGKIGTVIRKQVPEYSYVNFDLPDNDAKDYEKLAASMKGSDVAIHLAWNTKTDNWLNNNVDPNDLLMTYNVYKAAYETGLHRVIMASSIHINDLLLWKGGGPIKPSDPISPDSPYGASKAFMEALGKFYAKEGLEVVCVRFMGLNSNNKPSTPTKKDPLAKKKWFSHRDCGNLIRSIISAPTVPNNFAVVYGVSNNTGVPVDTSNPFGWSPEDNSSEL